MTNILCASIISPMGDKRDMTVGMKVLRIALITVGAFLIADTLFVATRSSLNLGVIMPFVIGTPMLICGLFLRPIAKLFTQKLPVRILMIAMIAVYVLFTLLFTFTTSLILINSSVVQQEADVLVVLGAGIRGTAPTLTLKYRLDTAVEYLTENEDTVVIVSGGRGEDEVVTEASVMREYLISCGIKSDRIILEENSHSTEENFIYSYEIITERFGEDASIAFITTRFHVYRAECVAKKLGIAAQGIPSKGVWYLTLNNYLRECAALTQYFLTGTI